MAESGCHQFETYYVEREFCCLTCNHCETVANGFIGVALVAFLGCGICLLASLGNSLQLSDQLKDSLLVCMAGVLLVGIIAFVAKRICRYLATKEHRDFCYAVLTVAMSIAVCSIFFLVLFHKKLQLIDEHSKLMGEIAVAFICIALVGLVILVVLIVYFSKKENQNENQQGNQNENQQGNQNENQQVNQGEGFIQRIARSFGRSQNIVHQIPEEPSTSGLEIIYNYPLHALGMPTARRSIRSQRNRNPSGSTVEAEVHRGPSTSRASETGHGSPRPVGHSSQGSPQQAQPFSSIEIDVERESITSTPRFLFRKETTEADKFEPIMTRFKTQQLKRSISTERSQEIKLQPDQLEESGGMGRAELRRRRLEPIETDRRLRSHAARKTSKIQNI